MFFKVTSVPTVEGPPKYNIFREEFCLHKEVDYLNLRLFYDDINQCRDTDMLETHEHTIYSGKEWRNHLAELDKQAFSYSYPEPCP